MGRDTIPIIAVFSTISWVAWLLFSSIRRYKIAQLQADIQGRLLQRFDSPDALLGYAQSEAGTQFIKSMEIERSTPYSQILKGVQAGIVFIFFGAGIAAASRLEYRRRRAARLWYARPGSGTRIWCCGGSLLLPLALLWSFGPITRARLTRCPLGRAIGPWGQ